MATAKSGVRAGAQIYLSLYNVSIWLTCILATVLLGSLLWDKTSVLFTPAALIVEMCIFATLAGIQYGVGTKALMLTKDTKRFNAVWPFIIVIGSTGVLGGFVAEAVSSFLPLIFFAVFYFGTILLTQGLIEKQFGEAYEAEMLVWKNKEVNALFDKLSQEVGRDKLLDEEKLQGLKVLKEKNQRSSNIKELDEVITLFQNLLYICDSYNETMLEDNKP